MRTDISRIHEKSKYTEMTPGNQIYGGGTSKSFQHRRMENFNACSG